MKKFLILNVVYALFLTSCASVPTPIDKKPSAAEINAQLGMAYLSKNEKQTAKERLLLALEEDPKLPAAWYSMAYFFETTGDIDQARKYYLKAVSLAPARGDVQNNYGTFLCRNGKYQEAVQHFLLATQDLRYFETGSAFENAGLCSLKIPDKKNALVYFNRAIRQDSKMPVSLYELAELNYELGNYRLAKEYLQQLLFIAPADSQTTKLAAKLIRKDES